MNLSETSRAFFKYIVILSALELIIGVLVLLKSQYLTGYVIGLVLGTALAIVKTIYLEYTAVKFLDMETKGAKRYYRISYFIRLILSFALLMIAAINHPQINLFSTFLGLINVQFAAHIYQFRERKKRSD